MRSVQITRFGPPEVLQLREAPDPRLGPGEVLIDVDLVEVLFLDTQLRSGWGKDFFPMRPPWIPGTGVGGTVRGTGRRVVARTGNEGAYAELVVVPEAEAIDVPAGLEPDVALAALHDGVLAQDRLDRAAITPGDRVLVTAAAGSLGQWFVPLLVRAGAQVTAAAGGPDKVAAVLKLGAAEALDYRDDGWAARAGQFDVVFDGAGGDIGRAALAHTRDGGRFFGHGAASGGFATSAAEPGIGRGIEVVGVEERIDDQTWRDRVAAGLRLLAAGVVNPVIGQRVPLARAADAHAAIERRDVIGKSVLTVE